MRYVDNLCEISEMLEKHTISIIHQHESCVGHNAPEMFQELPREIIPTENNSRKEEGSSPL